MLICDLQVNETDISMSELTGNWNKEGFSAECQQIYKYNDKGRYKFVVSNQKYDGECIINVYKDGSQIQTFVNSSEISVSLLPLSLGLHNFTLVIRLQDQIYKDLVWIRALEDEVDITADVLVPVGTGIFVIAIIVVLVFNIKKRYF